MAGEIVPLRTRSRIKTREAVDEAIASGGPIPLVVMLENLKYWHDQAVAFEASSSPDDKIHARIARANAQRCAEAAAPYVHARLANVAVGGDEEAPLRHVHSVDKDQFRQSLAGKTVQELGAMFLAICRGEDVTAGVEEH